MQGTTAAFDTDAAVGDLRQRGLRATSARLNVLAGLHELGHATADQLHAALVPRLPSLSLSTVYRTLESLSGHDLVRHAHLTGHVLSYSLASGTEHAHLVCSRCGTVQNLARQTLHSFVTELARSAQFAVNTSHLSVEGVCAHCQELDHDDDSSPPTPLR